MEVYANDIFNRAGEIDNIFSGLNLAIEYLKQTNFPESDFDFKTHHSYHIENFILRSIGIVDRCFLLAGTSILLDKQSIEKIGGNKHIKSELTKYYPKNIVNELEKIESITQELRSTRNKIAHNSGYSNVSLSTLSSIEHIDKKEAEKLTDIMPVERLTKLIISDTLDMLCPLISKLHESVSELISHLSYIYNKLLNA